MHQWVQLTTKESEELEKKMISKIIVFSVVEQKIVKKEVCTQVDSHILFATEFCVNLRIRLKEDHLFLSICF